MRPGPGLVVMALAFISGARRGSTSSISSKTSTTTTTTSSLPPSPTQHLILPKTTPSPEPSYFELFQTTSTSQASSVSLSTNQPATGNSIITTTTTLPPTTQQTIIYEDLDFANSKSFIEQRNDHQPSRQPKEETVSFNTFLTRDTYNSYPTTSTFFTYTYPLPSYIQEYNDDTRARAKSLSALQSAKQTRRANIKYRRRRKRKARSANVRYRGSGSEINDANDNFNDSDDTPTLLTTTVDSSSDRTTLARGLPVHFPSITAAESSKSLDEDDIFALVAEDDLLSEESFDHLIKLTNDKIGDTNEEDYSSGTETIVESSSGSGNGALENVHDTSDQQNAIEDFVPTHKQLQPEQIQEQQQKENPQILEDNENSDSDSGDGSDDGKERANNENHNSEQDVIDTVYNAHLVVNANEEAVLLNEADTIDVTRSSDKAEEENKQLETTTTPANTKAELKKSNKYKTILESNFALTRLNPWISACDLAQPGPLSAPDLQGKCSAGTLPVAWVDEGPGPPTSLKSCEEETPFTNKLNKDNMINSLINDNSNKNNNNKKHHKNKNDNKLNKLVGYTTTTNTLNIKLRNSQPTTSHSVNTNDNNKNSNINNNKNMDNNKTINKFHNIIQKLLNPFNYYQIKSNSNNNNNNNNNKMPKTKRNSKSITSATVQQNTNVALKTKSTSNVTQTDIPKDSESEDYDLLHDIMMQQDKAAKNKQIEHNNDHQFNDAAITAAAVPMQLNQQQSPKNHNNNKIVKMKLTATARLKDDDSPYNYQNKQFDLKYNHKKHDHLDNSNNNNINSNFNKRHQSNNINSSQRSDAKSTNTTATTTNNIVVAVNNQNSDQYLNKSPPEKQQQQCLEYLGDCDKTMPTHLCHYLTPSERLAQLRHLRLRNCCERNAYSALHTMALNATLSGGAGCLRVLEDLMALDAQASRITCGLTEILFRFDCRQVYSIIHQCNDCKEAYRRWVCSTLVPYFAETSDIMKPPEILTTTMESTSALSTSSDEDTLSTSQSYNNHEQTLNNDNTTSTTMASNLTTSHNTATLANNNNNGTDTTSSVGALKTVTSNFITNSNNNKHDMQYDANNYQQQQRYMQHHQQQEPHHMNKRNIQNKQHVNGNIINNNSHTSSSSSSSSSSSNGPTNNNINDFNYEMILIHHKNQTQQQQLQHPTNFTTSSLALTYHDIITHNSWLASPKNFLRSTLNQRSINENNEPTFGRNSHHKSTNKRRKRSDNSTIITAINAEAFANKPSMSLFSSSASITTLLHHTQRQKEQLEKQSFNFISTANNEDSFNAKNPVITKLLKRTKRKEFEFRKRRRIRPCLSVCQTVEQKCPYLLPSDRAPAMPTQYAGESTFLCLDYKIAETDEQLKKASHGPNECCYTHCSNSADGICTYCDEMWQETEIDKAAEALSRESETKVFNITMKTKGQGQSAGTIRVESKIQHIMGEDKDGLKMSTVAIAVRNDTALENATRLAERLQYYAFCDGVFYYDDDADDMPETPLSANCQRLPAVQSRCTIPYYASNYISAADTLRSYRKTNEAQKLLVWLSTLVCLWSCYSARSLRIKRFTETKIQKPTVQIQNQHKLKNTAFNRVHMCQSCQTRDIMQIKEKYNEKVIEIWCDYRESKVFIIFCLKIRREKVKSLVNKKSLKESHLTNKHSRQVQRGSSSVANDLKILKIPSLILLINYKEILLLLFKKRQKLRKRKVRLARGMMALHEISWSIISGSSFKNLRTIPKVCSFIKNKFHYYTYYYDYYYYCSCSQIFSCSCNKNIKYNYYNNNENYINKFQYNFKTCNFNNKTIHNSNNNKMIIMKIIYKKLSIIKFNTTTTKTHKLVLISYNTELKINNKFNIDNIITIIIISYNIYNNKKIFKSFSLKTKNSYCYYYNYYYNKVCNNFNNNYIYYFQTKFKSNKNIITIKDNNILLDTSLLSKTSTITITFYNFLKLSMISKIILMITMIILILLILFTWPLLFKLIIKMKKNKNNNNNNHHMKNVITSKLKISFSHNSSLNSKKLIYHCCYYYYNFNINDWWQRQRWRRRRPRRPRHLAKTQHFENYNYFCSYPRQCLLLMLPNGLSSPESYSTYILL